MEFFRGCTALITGASSGIGMEIARQLAPYADTLILTARRTERLESLKNELTGEGAKVFTYALDLQDEAKMDGFLEWLEGEGFHVNFLVNNAGLGDHGRFMDGDWKKVKQMLGVNVFALTRLTYALLQTMRQLPQAAILNVSSIASFLPLPKMAVYAATKAYVTSFSEALRIELKETNISVTALCPGPVSTEFGNIARRQNEQDEMPAPEIFKIPVEQVAYEALRAVSNDRARIVPGWFIAFVMTITTMVPFFILRFFLSAGAKK